VARVDAPAESWAHAEELRRAVVAFRASGKPAVAHAQSFSEAGDAVLAYLVASAFDEVHLQPTGELAVRGVASVQPFVARLLEQLGVTPQFGHRHEYKTAANLLTEEAFTDAHREAADRIVASLHGQLLDAVADGRRLTRDRVAGLLDRAPLSAEEAREAGLVDRLTYRDQTVAATLDRAGDGARLVTLTRYAPVARRHDQRPARTRIALIHGHGMIQVGRARRSVLGPVMGRRPRRHRLRAGDPRPEGACGGVPGREPRRVGGGQRRDLAGRRPHPRGGHAGRGLDGRGRRLRRLLGVDGRRPHRRRTRDAHRLDRGGLRQARHPGARRAWGITTDEVHRGANALMMAADRPFTDAQWERIDGFLDRVYADFVDRVADGRRLDRERVHAVAKGRVWTGADAVDLGLVDELGGYREAFDAARRLAGVAPDARVQVRVLPRLPLSARLGLRPSTTAEVRALTAGLAALGRALRTTGTVEARMPDVPR
jgi:protease IV